LRALGEREGFLDRAGRRRSRRFEVQVGDLLHAI